jgi:hypothetical protein
MAWAWAAASRRGTSHERTGVRLQDAFVCETLRERPEVLIAIVSDGAGSARLGGEGAALVCRTLSVELRRYFERSSDLPSEVDMYTWLDAARDRISAVAARRAMQKRDFACTLVAFVSTVDRSIIAHVGDGCAVVQDSHTDAWVAASWPDQGEYASGTFFVTDDPAARLRISVLQAPVKAVAVFTDGLERLVLDMSQRKPSAAFFQRISDPVHAAPTSGRSAFLSERLGAYLESDPVRRRTDDDVTLVIATRK